MSIPQSILTWLHIDLLTAAIRLAWPDAADVSNSARRPYVRNRLSMIRHLHIGFGPLRTGDIRQPFSPRARPEILESWRSFIHPEPDSKSHKNTPADFPALRDLYLDFSWLRLDAGEVIFVGYPQSLSLSSKLMGCRCSHLSRSSRRGEGLISCGSRVWNMRRAVTHSRTDL